MSRYGWSLSREATSPYHSVGGMPVVMDDDFTYITSQELGDTGHSDSRYYPRSRHHAPADLEDDILLIKNRGVTYPAHFPAYSIGDGKLYVKDVRDRIGVMMDISGRTTKRIKLLYKGRHLKDSNVPVREYGVKNKSELMAVIPEGEDEETPSVEEMVIVDEVRSEKGRNRRRKKPKKTSSKDGGDSASSPRDSNSTIDRPGSPLSPIATGPMKKLDEISGEFEDKWLPLCLDYTRSPPSDEKKRVEEHRRLSESVLQHVILKLDSVETEGIAEVRLRRKELVRQVQEVLKQLDTAKAS